MWQLGHPSPWRTWVNVYGKAKAKAGQRLPGTGTYPTVDAAVAGAGLRSSGKAANEFAEIRRLGPAQAKWETREEMKDMAAKDRIARALMLRKGL